MPAISATKSEILSAVAEGTMSPEEASKLLSAMVEPRPLSLKVSPKGALSVYGLQRMPVTLYIDQWERLWGFSDELKAFAEANKEELSRKGKPKSQASNHQQLATNNKQPM